MRRMVAVNTMCNVLFFAVTGKLYIKYLVKNPLPAMLCIMEGIGQR